MVVYLKIQSFLSCLQKIDNSSKFRAVARSEIPGGLAVLGGDNVSPLVEIGLTDLPKTGGEGALAPPVPCCRYMKVKRI